MLCSIYLLLRFCSPMCRSTFLLYVTLLSCALYQVIKHMIQKWMLLLSPYSWFAYALKGGPEPLENEINKILGSKREDRFSDHFSDLVQNICSVCFSYLLRLSIFCKAPRDKVPAEVPEDSRVLRERRLWFPTSDRLETWLIPSWTTRSRQ